VLMGSLGAGWFTVESMEPYLLFGASNGAATTNGEWWRLVTSIFVHFGLMHLLLNMWALYQAGHFLEKLQGRWIYTLTYLGSGLAGGLLSIAVHGDKVWSAGASGAIFGVYGAILGYMVREKQGLPPGIYKPMMKSTLSFAAYNILYGMKDGVDNSSHIGGVLSGFVLGWLLALPVNAEVRQQQTRKKLQLGLAAVAALLVAGVLLTPRFDYIVAEEIQWENTNKEFIAKESDLLQQNLTGLTAVEKGSDGAAHASWMLATLVPFYRGWDSHITALTLVPGRRTARRRDALDKIFRMRVEEYGLLIDELRSHHPEALAHYVQSEGLVSLEFAKLKKQ
jgi:rhomboid protease GluP